MDIKFYYAVKCIRYLSDILLLAALAFALYGRWVVTNDVTIAMLAMMSCFVFPIALAFSYYFQMKHIRYFSLSEFLIIRKSKSLVSSFDCKTRI